jgi:PAS domain-containing protein
LDNNISEGVILFDQDSKILSVNKQFKDIMGINKLEGTRRGTIDFGHALVNLGDLINQKTPRIIDMQTRIQIDQL